jgi:hypothetical protein
MLNQPPPQRLYCSQGIATSPSEAAVVLLNRPSFRPELSIGKKPPTLSFRPERSAAEWSGGISALATDSTSTSEQRFLSGSTAVSCDEAISALAAVSTYCPHRSQGIARSPYPSEAAVVMLNAPSFRPELGTGKRPPTPSFRVKRSAAKWNRGISSPFSGSTINATEPVS